MHRSYSGSPCLASAPCLWSEQAESKLQLSEAVPRSLCRETLSPSLLQTLQGLDFSVLATWSPLLSSLLPEFVFRPTVSPHPLNLPPAGRLFCYTQANTARPPFAESSNQISEFGLCNSWWEHRHPVDAIHLVLT